MIDNRFEADLEPELWEGDELTEGLLRGGHRLDALGLLPAPFPLHEIVPEKELRAIKRIYGIGGLSYGNLSVRKDERRFWMSASGVDKSNLRVVGKDVLMVKDYEAGDRHDGAVGAARDRAQPRARSTPSSTG